jgi:hypothetical protein
MSMRRSRLAAGARHRRGSTVSITPGELGLRGSEPFAVLATV